ncbi:hypothetical protein TNIN_61011 [Trichonephila inaurata madagascariensis]|uniref:Uncharacterized protein n=1 Tax=Trichonephila inaurata madagascariensis TaxID=2747483 RepID=A0A8X6YMR5_9ARAC|nr:hypothetical protein TNIN_61011 [Trichonephila inaurata madagascariensis]
MTLRTHKYDSAVLRLGRPSSFTTLFLLCASLSIASTIILRRRLRVLQDFDQSKSVMFYPGIHMEEQKRKLQARKNTLSFVVKY